MEQYSMNRNQYSLIWVWEEYNKVLIARSDTHNYGQKSRWFSENDTGLRKKARFLYYKHEDRTFECYHGRIKQLEENSWLLIVE